MKKLFSWLALGIFFFAGVYASITMANMPRTYDGRTGSPTVYELQQDPASYNDSNVDGAAGAIVQQNLDRTHAVNDVTSIVFDFRGYDTMGEAFILITAVAGTTVIIYSGKKEKKEEGSKDEE